jgi:hypothetical protein
MKQIEDNTRQKQKGRTKGGTKRKKERKPIRYEKG